MSSGVKIAHRFDAIFPAAENEHVAGIHSQDLANAARVGYHMASHTLFTTTADSPTSRGAVRPHSAQLLLLFIILCWSLVMILQ